MLFGAATLLESSSVIEIDLHADGCMGCMNIPQFINTVQYSTVLYRYLYEKLLYGILQ